MIQVPDGTFRTVINVLERHRGEWVSMPTLMANGLKKDVAFEVMGILIREGKVRARNGGDRAHIVYREYALA